MAKGTLNSPRPRLHQELEAGIAEGTSEGLVQGTEKLWFQQAYTGAGATRSFGCMESL